MGVMAIQAANLINQWPVHPILVEGLVNHILVTFPAQLGGFLFGLESIRRSGFLMALVAPFLGYVSMGNIKNNSPVIGAMGTVAGVTVGIRHRIFHVGCFES